MQSAQFLAEIPTGAQRQTDVLLTSMQFDDVASTSVWRHFNVIIVHAGIMLKTVLSRRQNIRIVAVHLFFFHALNFNGSRRICLNTKISYYWVSKSHWPRWHCAKPFRRQCGVISRWCACRFNLLEFSFCYRDHLSSTMTLWKKTVKCLGKFFVYLSRGLNG